MDTMPQYNSQFAEVSKGFYPLFLIFAKSQHQPNPPILDNDFRNPFERDDFKPSKQENSNYASKVASLFNNESGNTSSNSIDLKNLEGFVHQINDKTFIVNLYDEKDKSRSSLYQAELKKSSFTMNEQSHLTVGSKVVATLTKFELANGEEKHTCKARLVPTRKISQEEIENLYQKADEFLERIEKNETT